MGNLAHLVLALAALVGSPPAKAQDKLAPYFPTPPSIVNRMLQLAELKKGEKMFDLGSGDGQIVIMAEKKFSANATGVEIDPPLCKQSTNEIKRQHLESS